MNNINEIIENFNTVSLELADQIVQIYPDSLFANNTYRMKSLVKLSKTKLIDQFVIHILIYKKYIDEKDDYIFTDNSILEAIKDSKLLTTLMSDIQTLWVNLNNTNKQKIFEYMQVQCYYANEYVIYIT
mgnify:CR=1 FL=1|jgi:hypothetical protein